MNEISPAIEVFLGIRGFSGGWFGGGGSQR